MSQPRLIHIIDDEDSVRRSASFMLKTSGFSVQAWASGVAFLKEVRHVEAGCILLDVRMPEMDGLEVQRTLHERGVTMPVIILTGHGDVSIAVRAMKAGAVDFIEKPFEKEVLLGQLISGWNHFFLYMEWFGFWVCDKDATGHYMQRLTATPFGMKMIPVLLKYRDIKLWNIPLRKEFGEVRPVSGSKIPDMETPGNADYQPFYKAFTTLFPIHELQDTLPRYFYSEG